MVDSAAMLNRLLNVAESLAPVAAALTLFQAPAPPSPEQIQAGQRLFAAQCGFCHGRDAMGGETGPNLTKSALVVPPGAPGDPGNPSSDAGRDKVAALLREGRTDKGMPAFRLTDADVSAIVVFVRDQKNKADKPGSRRTVDIADLKTGDAERGRQYFSGRCARCHSPAGDLAGIAKRLEGLELLQRMLYPSKSTAATVTVTPRQGEAVSGALAYRDEFTIALTEKPSGRYRSWRTGDVTFTVDNPLDAHVEQLGAYTDDDIHNVLAYLQTLR
jgi:cytochrome c oxidase cbb3-type subunit 3